MTTKIKGDLMLKTIDTTTLKAQEVLDLLPFLTLADQRWLAEQLNQLTNGHEDDVLPQQATLEEAIQFYLADRCSVAKAADLAGITRWELQDILYERGTPVEIYGHHTVEEIDALAEKLEREGVLCSSSAIPIS
jgi:predicted HTH domain antitoxin